MLCLDGSDDEVLADDDKRSQQQQYQKKKRRPSFKRRKKAVYDHTQTDSGIDSRMGRTKMFMTFNRHQEWFTGNFSSYLDPKGKGKCNIAPEPSSSSNVVISNEDDSSLGDYTKDSKVSRIRHESISTTCLLFYFIRIHPLKNWKNDQQQIGFVVNYNISLKLDVM